MTRFVLAAALLATPALAQETGGAPDEGGSLIGKGAGLLLRGLVEEARPAVEGAAEGIAGISAEVLPTLRLLGQEMGPAFVEVFGRIDSIANYEPPAIQPNGDILIRRSPDAPAWTPPAAEPEADADPAP